MKIVRLDELEFEDWVSTKHLGAHYQGQPFTGIALQIKDQIYHEYHYKKGRAHGKWYEFNQRTGEMQYEGTFKQAIMIGVHRAANEGFKRLIHCDESGSEIIRKYWNPEGILIEYYDRAKEIDEKYYHDGGLYLMNKKGKDGRTYRSYFLGTRKLWLLKEIGFDEQKSKFVIEFNHLLFKEQFNHLNSTFHLLLLEWYVEHLIIKDKQMALEIVKKCLTHLDPLFQRIGVSQAFDLGDEKIIPYLQKLTNIEALFYEGPFGSISWESLGVLSKRAIRHIKKIKKTDI